MVGIRAQQKEKTRRALIDAAFNQLTAEKSFSNLSLREVSREAGIAPTSFYPRYGRIRLNDGGRSRFNSSSAHAPGAQTHCQRR